MQSKYDHYPSKVKLLLTNKSLKINKYLSIIKKSQKVLIIKIKNLKVQNIQNGRKIVETITIQYYKHV